MNSASESLELLEPCARGNHVPVILHRTRNGGNDAMYRNVCGLCGREIHRKDIFEQWATEAQQKP